MKVISFNANGIRSAARKGFFDWFLAQDADVLCIQETKAQEAQLSDPIFHPAGYHTAFFDAEKKGYSGVAIYSKHKPDAITLGLDYALADTEGRYIDMHFGELTIASLYLPSGSSGDIRQNLKFEFLDFFGPLLAEKSQDNRPKIICGDWNIVHKEIDIKNWKSNQKSSGCLPEERAWLDKVFGDYGWSDAFRLINQEPEQYTWWSNRGRAYENNVGWRIDYQAITQSLADKVTAAEVYKAEKFSDHAPLIIEYDHTI